MTTGVSVSNSRRVFVNFPKWTGDPVEYTVAEVKNGKTFPYPNAEINRFSETDNPADKFVSVQSVVVGSGGNRLWILETGVIDDRVKPGGGKLIALDVGTNQIVKKIVFSPDVVLPETRLNDVRFDLHRGRERMAFITDTSNTLIVADLATQKSWRRLANHISTKPDPHYVPVVEGEVFPRQPGPPETIQVGADGIAISPDGKTLYYWFG